MKKKRDRCTWECNRSLLRLIKIVRLTLVLILFVNVNISAKGFSQTVVSLKLENSSMEEIIKEVKKVSEYRFLYSLDEIKQYTNRNFDVNSAELEVVMKELLAGTDLTYEVENGVIMIKPSVKSLQARQQETVSVEGNVKDQQGDPLPGVTITLKGTSSGGITGMDGNFKFQISPEDSRNIILVFSFVGMKTVERAYRGVPLNIIMEEDLQEVEEVVVTGIFTRKKEGFTGSVTRITQEEIRQLSSGNVLKALEMLDPSFKMNVSNISGSNPNAIPEYTLRGQANLGDYQADDLVMMRGDMETRPNQPLFVLDGVIGVKVTDIMDLDPEQVEAITILKDAAATVIYGSEAANGVIVVETKKPLPGKLRFTYNGNYGLMSPDLSDYNLTNAREKLEVEERAGYYNTTDIGILNYYTALRRDVDRGVNTYWLAKPLQNSFSHRHGLNIEGGDQALRYKVYLGASFAPGVMKNTDLNTKSGRIDIQYRYGKFMVMNQTYLNYSKGRRESNYGDFYLYARMNPYFSPYDENGNIKKNLDPSLPIGGYHPNNPNPLWNTLFDSRNENRGFDVKESLKVEYNPKDNMRFSIDFNISKSNEVVETFKSSEHTEMVYYSEPSFKGRYEYFTREGWDYRLMFTGSYNKAFNEDHVLALYGQYMINDSYSNSMRLTMTGFPNDRMTEVYLGTNFKSITGSENRSKKIGFAFTANYSYKFKYAVDYSMRLDASSQFGENNRFAPFWSVGGRWNANRETFIRNLNIFDELILRASYGVTGSQGFDSYQALQMYTYDGMMKDYRGSDVVGVKLYGIGNPDLKWQQTRNYNGALDFTILDGMVSARAEYYYKLTKNTVLDFTLAPSTGFPNVKDNLGSISNKGLELSLKVTPYKDASKQAYWNITANGVHNRSKIEKISEALKYRNEQQRDSVGKYNRPLPIYESGYSPNAIWAVPSLGIDPVTGREVFVKKDGSQTNQWEAKDMVRIVDAEPDFSGSLSTTFSYKGLSVTVAGRYTFGGHMYNKTLVEKVENADLRMNVDKRVLYDRWAKPGDIAEFKKIMGDTPNPAPGMVTTRDITKATSRFVMKRNEFEISTINLSYRMDNNRYSFLRRAGLTAATVGLYFEDIWRKSTIKMERGIDYPFARRFSMSLNLMF